MGLFSARQGDGKAVGGAEAITVLSSRAKEAVSCKRAEETGKGESRSHCSRTKRHTRVITVFISSFPE
jgi:hypothetical protein